jgi:hypothetical protein
MPSVTLSDAEVRRLLTGRLLVVRPFPKANEIDSDGTVLTANAVCPARVSGYIAWFGRNIHDSEALVEFTKQQYEHGIPNPLGTPGDVLACKEAVWWPTCLNCGDGKYVADCPERPGYMYEKVPAQRLPPTAVRLRPTVIEAGVMRVGEMTDANREDAGLDIAKITLSYGEPDTVLESVVAETNARSFAANWNRRFRKYPWESNCWIWWALVKTPEQAERDEWAQRKADKKWEMEQDAWEEEQNA